MVPAAPIEGEEILRMSIGGSSVAEEDIAWAIDPGAGDEVRGGGS